MASGSLSGMRPVVRPPSGKPAGAAFNLNPSSARPRPPSAPGGSFVQTGAAASPTVASGTLARPPAPPAAAPAPPDLSGDKWQGYLTPDQLAALRTSGTNTDTGVGQQIRREGDAQAQYQQTMGDAQYAHDVSQQQANDEMAGRGLFLSGIRDHDLTDINRTLVERQTTATANLNSLIADATAAITNLQTNWGTTVQGYQGDAAASALAQVQPPSPAGPAPAAPAAPRPPAPPAPPRATGASFTQTSAVARPARPGAQSPAALRAQPPRRF